MKVIRSVAKEIDRFIDALSSNKITEKVGKVASFCFIELCGFVVSGMECAKNLCGRIKNR
jgi:hypothetical protein